MNMLEITNDPGWPFVGYMREEDGSMYCKACGAKSREEHSDTCPQMGHWPSEEKSG